MSAPRIVAAIAIADLRQRLRAPRTWLLLAGLAALSWWSFPPVDADYLTVSFGQGARARYSSAWVGLVIASIYGALLSLAGFYVVRGTVVRDFDTGVWQLLVATPMHRAGYLAAKWLSHLALFGLMLAAGMATGVVAQFVRGEVPVFDALELVKPVVLVALPALALTATFAVWFDLVPWLRRSAGNVAYFFVWTFLLATNIARGEHGGGWPGDPQGMLAVESALSKHAAATGAGLGGGGLSVGTQALEGKAPLLFDWTQWNVGADLLAARGLWIAIAVVALLAAAPLLDRFAAQRAGARAASTEGRRLRLLDILLAPLRRSAFGALVSAEVQLALRPRRRRWFVAMGAVYVAQAVAPEKGLVAAVLAGWLLSMDVFGRAVLRELDTRTGALVFTASGMRSRLLGARVIVAVGLAWTVTAPAIVRFAVQSPAAALALLVTGASIALWGLALGALFRNARPFELVLVASAYVSLQGALVLNAVVDPGATLAGHALALPVAVGMLFAAWRPLSGQVR
ncbi:ABC transporter permease [Lysobacter humi (ex Lee et al. 2017)]